MAAAVAAIVNGGRLMRPYLVAEVRSPAGALLQTTQPVCTRQVIRPETSAVMRQMMEAVVTGGGGQKAQIAGYRVGGKSGTSQKLDSADPKARIASFVAVAPIDDPQLLCLICLDEPHRRPRLRRGAGAGPRPSRRAPHRRAGRPRPGRTAGRRGQFQRRVILQTVRTPEPWGGCGGS